MQIRDGSVSLCRKEDVGTPFFSGEDAEEASAHHLSLDSYADMAVVV